MSINKKEIIEALSQIKYPGFKRDIVSFGFIKNIKIEEDTVVIDFAPTTRDREIISELKNKIETQLKNMKAVDSFRINLIKPGGEKQKQNQNAGQLPKKEKLPGVKNVIAVASGKGGVGKSTVAVNLAAALVKEGQKTGLLDLDIYGPSIPTMFSLQERPRVDEKNQNKVVPLDYKGLKIMSLGFVINPVDPVIWRGPMVGKAVKQLLREVTWDNLDYLIIDLPPGTGDTQISLLQLIPVSGAVIVTTPQEVALSDVRKAAGLFEKMDTPVMGIVENMAGYVCPECGHESDIFGSGGGSAEADRLNVDLLGKIPLEQSLRQSGDEGEPLVFSGADSKTAEKFQTISQQLIKKTEQK